MPTPPRALCLVAAVLLPLCGNGCSDGSFAGKNNAAAQPANTDTAGATSGASDADAKAAGSSKSEIDSGANGGSGAEKQSSDSANSTGPTTSVDASTGVDTGIDTDTATVTGSIKKQIAFGVNEVFHIGDGQFAQTACKARVQSYTLSGGAFRFAFTVLTDSTLVSIAIGTICGLNQGYGDYAALEGPGGQLQRIPMGPAQYEGKTLTFTAAMLGKGDYQIVVYSGYGQDNRTDRDDFIVGNITIKGNNDIKQGEITHTAL